jgi:hypothetical protein
VPLISPNRGMISLAARWHIVPPSPELDPVEVRRGLFLPSRQPLLIRRQAGRDTCRISESLSRATVSQCAGPAARHGTRLNPIPTGGAVSKTTHQDCRPKIAAPISAPFLRLSVRNPLLAATPLASSIPVFRSVRARAAATFRLAQLLSLLCQSRRLSSLAMPSSIAAISSSI